MNNCIDFLDKLLHSQCGKVVIKKKNQKKNKTMLIEGFPDGSVVKDSPVKQETLIQSRGQENLLEDGSPLQYSCQGNSKNREV